MHLLRSKETETMATKNGQSFYTKSTLASFLGISEEAAQELMIQEDFPATFITDGVYVVTHNNLVGWIEKNARSIEGVNHFPGPLDDLLFV